MQFYAYIPREDGSEPVGTENQMIIRDLKTIRGAINRIKKISRWNDKGFKLFSYVNLYNSATHTLVHHHKKQS